MHITYCILNALFAAAPTLEDHCAKVGIEFSFDTNWPLEFDKRKRKPQLFYRFILEKKCRISMIRWKLKILYKKKENETFYFMKQNADCWHTIHIDHYLKAHLIELFKLS